MQAHVGTSPVQPLTWPKGQGRSARLPRSMFVPGGSKSRRCFDSSVPASSNPHINLYLTSSLSVHSVVTGRFRSEGYGPMGHGHNRVQCTPSKLFYRKLWARRGSVQKDDSLYSTVFSIDRTKPRLRILVWLQQKAQVALPSHSKSGSPCAHSR